MQGYANDLTKGQVLLVPESNIHRFKFEESPVIAGQEPFLKVLYTSDTVEWGFSVYRNRTNCSGMYIHNFNPHIRKIGMTFNRNEIRKDFTDMLKWQNHLTEFHCAQFSVSPSQDTFHTEEPMKKLGYDLVKSRRRGASAYNYYWTLAITTEMANEYISQLLIPTKKK